MQILSCTGNAHNPDAVAGHLLLRFDLEKNNEDLAYINGGGHQSKALFKFLLDVNREFVMHIHRSID